MILIFNPQLFNFLKCFWPPREKKYFFFQKCPKYGLVSEKTRKKVFNFSGNRGGVFFFWRLPKALSCDCDNIYSNDDNSGSFVYLFYDLRHECAQPMRQKVSELPLIRHWKDQGQDCQMDCPDWCPHGGGRLKRWRMEPLLRVYWGLSKSYQTSCVGQADSCTMEGIEGVLEIVNLENIAILGWIHTHPTSGSMRCLYLWSCLTFLSWVNVLAAMMSSGLSASSAAGGRGTDSVWWLTYGDSIRGLMSMLAAGPDTELSGVMCGVLGTFRAWHTPGRGGKWDSGHQGNELCAGVRSEGHGDIRFLTDTDPRRGRERMVKKGNRDQNFGNGHCCVFL